MKIYLKKNNNNNKNVQTDIIKNKNSRAKIFDCDP